MTKIKDIDINKLPMLNVGMFGHIDHGKTTLLSKLTGKFADTHSEELKRGITIKLGYADAIIYKDNKKYGINSKEGKPERYITFVDAPGHEMLMATTLSGTAIIDAAILVIAANEVIQPQTQEHLVALQAKGIKQIIICQNKIDLVTREEAKKNYHDIKNFIKGTLAENSIIIPVSAQQAINIGKILEELCKLNIPKRDTQSEPLFLVARSFDINKPGTKIKDLHGGVLGGALKKGKLKIGQKIEIKPGLSLKKANQLVYETVTTKILTMKKGKYPIKEAIPGGSLALETELDPSLTKADSLTGCVAGLKDKLPDINSKIKIKFKLFEKVLGTKEKIKVEDLKTTEPILLSVNTTITVGTITKIKGNEAEFSLKIPIIPFREENVGIARNIMGHWRLIGFGELV